MKTSLCLVGILALGGLSSAARADLAPSPGLKRVSYQLNVNVTGDTSNQVVFAYPCSGSNGAPGRHVTPLTGTRGVPVGNHETCEIYVVAKDAYDAWAKDAGPEPDGTADGLISKAKVCTGTIPHPNHSLTVIDPRSSLSDDIDVKIESGSCAVTAHTAATPVPPAVTPEKKSGCNASGSSSFPLLLALPALVLLLKKRRA